MSRSGVVAVVAASILLGVLGVLLSQHWVALDHRVWWQVWSGPAIGAIAACCAGAATSRIAYPHLKTPVLLHVTVIVLGVGVFILWVVSLFSSSRRSRYDDGPSYRRGYSSRSTTTTTTTGTKDPGMGLAWAIASTILSLGAYAGAIALMLWLADHVPAAEATAKPKVASAATATPAPAPVKPAVKPVATPPTDIMGAADLAAAIAFAKPNTVDNRHTPSPAAKQLARWAAVKLAWADVAIATNETSMELAEKDPMKAAGKRLCAHGILARIEKATVEGAELYTARLVTKTSDALEVYAVGSTGDLVKRKPAHFCGVVTGRLDVDGKPSTFAVGMFEAR